MPTLSTIPIKPLDTDSMSCSWPVTLPSRSIWTGLQSNFSLRVAVSGMPSYLCTDVIVDSSYAQALALPAGIVRYRRAAGNAIWAPDSRL